VTEPEALLVLSIVHLEYISDSVVGSCRARNFPLLEALALRKRNGYQTVPHSIRRLFLTHIPEKL